ncbi:MAG: type 4a pilus biogenesis protein PilO [Candidatus Caldatribacteriota bacterium]|nr:type 4a pilus biogenesis protein PilO [Candidatus Caldatribacteriota bacterium]
MKLSKGMVVFIIVVLVAIFAYANYAYIYTPRRQRIEQLDRDIEITAKKIEEGRRIAARLEPLKKEYAALKERLAFLEVMLPKEKEIPDLLVMIQDTLTEFNVDFTNFTPQNISWQKDKIYGNMPLSMSLTASYYDLIAYLDRIEHLPRIIDAKSLRLSKSGKDLEKLNISLSMFTYVLRKGVSE